MRSIAVSNVREKSTPMVRSVPVSVQGDSIGVIRAKRARLIYDTHIAENAVKQVSDIRARCIIA